MEELFDWKIAAKAYIDLFEALINDSAQLKSWKHRKILKNNRRLCSVQSSETLLERNYFEKSFCGRSDGVPTDGGASSKGFHLFAWSARGFLAVGLWACPESRLGIDGPGLEAP